MPGVRMPWMNDADGNYYVYAFTAPTEYASDPIKHYAKQIDLSVVRILPGPVIMLSFPGR